MKRFYFVGVSAFFLVFAISTGYGQVLTVDTFVDLFIKNSFAFKIQGFNTKEAKTHTQEFLGIYDFIIKSQVSYSKSVPYELDGFGSEVSAFGVEGAITKQFPFGLSFSATWDTDYQESTPKLSFPGLTQTKGYYHTITLSAQASLLNNLFGKVEKLQLEQLQSNETVAKFQTLQAIASLLENGIAIYQNWFLSKRTVKLRKRNLARAKKMHNLNRKKFEDGLIEEGELAQSRVSIHSRAIELQGAESNLQQANHAMASFLNLPITKVTRFRDPDLSRIVTPYPKVSVRDLFHWNPDVALEREQVKTKDVELRRFENDLLFDVSLFTELNLEDSDRKYGRVWDELFDNPDFTVGIKLEVPLGNTAKEAKHERARLGKLKSELKLENAKKEVLEDYNSAVETLQNIRSRIDATQKLLHWQRKALDFEVHKFGQGRSSFDLIKRFQDDLTLYYLQRAQLIADFVKTRIEAQLIDASLLRNHKLAVGQKDHPRP